MRKSRIDIRGGGKGSGREHIMHSDHDNSGLKSSHSYVYVDIPNSNLLCCICRSVFASLFHLPTQYCPSGFTSSPHKPLTTISAGHGANQPNLAACLYHSNLSLPLNYSLIPLRW